jgi:hypothetical protein
MPARLQVQYITELMMGEVKRSENLMVEEGIKM